LPVVVAALLARHLATLVRLLPLRAHRASTLISLAPAALRPARLERLLTAPSAQRVILLAALALMHPHALHASMAPTFRARNVSTAAQVERFWLALLVRHVHRLAPLARARQPPAQLAQQACFTREAA
jgi:hypothetical protein